MAFVAGAVETRRAARKAGLTTAARGTGDTATGRAAWRATFAVYANPEAAFKLAMWERTMASAQVRRGLVVCPECCRAVRTTPLAGATLRPCHKHALADVTVTVTPMRPRRRNGFRPYLMASAQGPDTAA